MTLSPAERRDICADAFMAAWAPIRGGQDLVFDTVEYVLRQHELANEIWNRIKEKYAAKEYPGGVLTFPSDPTSTMRALVITEIASHKFEKLVGEFRARLQTYQFA